MVAALSLDEFMQVREPHLTVISFGGGQDSTAILYRMVYDELFRKRYAPRDLLVLMADTGDEHGDTLEHVEEVKAFCAEHSVEFVHLTHDLGYHRGAWVGGLRNMYRTHNVIGSVAYPKTCTVNLKIDPMYRFLEVYVAERYGLSKTGRKVALKEFASIFGKVRVLIGFAADEDRAGDPNKEPPWSRQAIEKVYPLQDYGMNRADCQRYIESVGHRVPPPSNCRLCPFKSAEEILWTAMVHPSDFAEWVQLEANKIAANEGKTDRNLGVKGAKMLPQVCEEAYAHFRPKFESDAALIAYLSEYRMSHGHCVKSKF